MGACKIFTIWVLVLLCSCKMASGQEEGREPEIIGWEVLPHFKYGNDSLRKYLNNQIKSCNLGRVYLDDFDHYALVLTISDSGRLLSTRCMVSCQGNEEYTHAMAKILEKCEWVAAVSSNGHGITYVHKDEKILFLYFNENWKDQIVKLHLAQTSSDY